MKVNPLKKDIKKIVIKWENVALTFYTIATLSKYFITANSNLLILLYDLILDTTLALFIYTTILILRKGQHI